jgi:thiamine-phosphate pyrophosphorylase
MIVIPRLYAIADAGFGNPVELARQLFDGGARLVQIRNKQASAAELLRQVEEIIPFVPSGARLIVNDRLDVALLSQAHGVHLGQDDLPAEHARRILGNAAIIGVSTHNLDQAVVADGLPVNYIAIGPIFATTSKHNPSPVLGLEKLQEICKAVRKPVVAIGGITVERAPEVYGAGASSVAVISDILKAKNICDRVREWSSL